MATKEQLDQRFLQICDAAAHLGHGGVGMLTDQNFWAGHDEVAKKWLKIFDQLEEWHASYLLDLTEARREFGESPIWDGRQNVATELVSRLRVVATIARRTAQRGH